MKIAPYYLLAIAAVFTTTAISAELLTNPGFESSSSSLTGWTVTSSNASAAILATAHSGTNSARLETSDKSLPYSAYVNATQSIPYDGSTEYTLTAYAMDNWSNGGNAMTDAVILKIQYYNASSTLLREDTASLSMPKDYSWHFYTLTSTDVPAGTATVKPVIGTIQFNEWMRSILFDDVSFTSITVIPPQPHTGDLNNNLYVNFEDFALLADDWQNAGWEDLFAMTDNWLTNYSNPLTIVPSAQTVEKYDHIFFDINSFSPYTNQYNPDNIRIDIILTDPDSNEIVLPCFYVSGNAAASSWQGRFTPQKTGQYSYQAKVFVDGAFDGISNVSYFTSINSTRDGIIHKNPDSYYFWKHDSGKAFRGIGENIAWDTRSYNNIYYHYEYMFPMLGDRGCNFVRIWLCNWNIPLEWANFGRYTESAAERLEEVLALAEENGIYLLISLDTYSAFKAIENTTWGGGDDWVRNPYNTINGGPCSSAAAFFTNTAAKKAYKNKLRYFIARWGYHPNVGAIEFFNEVDHLYDDGDADVPGADIVSWHNEMSTHLKSIDPFKHLVTTSFSWKSITGLWNVSNIDFTQTHPYGSTDGAYSTITSYENNFGKPYVMEEFGYSWESAGTSSNHYLFRRELHMGMWRGMFSPTPVLPMVWWWENLAYYNDWDVFNATANFSNQIVADSSGYLANLSVNVGTGIEKMGVQTAGKMFVWLRNSSSSTISGRTMTITGLQNGSYQVNYYNTWTGVYSSPSTVSVTAGTLSSSIPSLAADGDIACRIVKLP